jgi:hypothetical protein
VAPEKLPGDGQAEVRDEMAGPFTSTVKVTSYRLRAKLGHPPPIQQPTTEHSPRPEKSTRPATMLNAQHRYSRDPRGAAIFG